MTLCCVEQEHGLVRSAWARVGISCWITKVVEQQAIYAGDHVFEFTLVERPEYYQGKPFLQSSMDIWTHKSRTRC